MRTIKSSFLFLALITSIQLGAQSIIISGNLSDFKTKQPIPFANIGIVNGNLGTVSSEKGVFKLTLPDSVTTGTFKVSLIGYHSLEFSLDSLLQTNTNGVKWELKSQTYDLEEVTILPGKSKEKEVGNYINSSFVSAGFKDNLLGYEIGTFMKSKHPARVFKTHIQFANCEYDSVFFRLNVYNMVDKEVGGIALQKPIYLSFSKADIENIITIDLTDQNLYVDGDFLVTLELVKDLGEGGLNFNAGFFGAPTIYKQTSQAGWQKAPVSISIAADIKQYWY